MKEARQPFTAKEVIAFQKRSTNFKGKNRATTKPSEEEIVSTIESDESYSSAESCTEVLKVIQSQVNIINTTPR